MAFRILRPFRFAALAALIALPLRAQDEGGAFAIGGIEVDTSAKSADAARQEGWREAQRKAWPQLWARLTGAPAANAPKLGDSALDGIVQAIAIEHEAIGPTRYVASLGVVFDRARASKYLGDSARMLRSSPMLLMPVLIDGGTRIAYEQRTPWLNAWARLPSDATPVDYVRAPGRSSDAVVLTAWQAYRPDRELWRAALQRYGAGDVVTAEATLTRSYPGGPVYGRFRALHGPDGEVLGGFLLSVSSDADLPKMLDIAVRRIDEIYTAALREGRLKAEEDLTVPITPVESFAPTLEVATAGQNHVTVDIETPDASALNTIQDGAETALGVVGVRAESVAIGGTSRLRIDYDGTLDALRYALDQAGFRLETGGARPRLRARRPDEAPLPPPQPPADQGTPAAPTARTEAVPETETPTAPEAPLPPPPPGPGAR